MTDLSDPAVDTLDQANLPDGATRKASSVPPRTRKSATLRLASDEELSVVAHALAGELAASNWFEASALDGNGEEDGQLSPKAALVLASSIRRRLAQQSMAIANRNPQRLGDLVKRKPR